MHLDEKLKFIFFNLIGTKGNDGLAGIDISSQFKPDEDSEEAMARNLNAAFLIALTSESHPQYKIAIDYLAKNSRNSDNEPVSFYQLGLDLINKEISDRNKVDEKFAENLSALYIWLEQPPNLVDRLECIEKIRQVFFPEGVGLNSEHKSRINDLRQRRRIIITKLNDKPIKDPTRQILFTSNALVTIPAEDTDIDSLSLKDSIKNRLKQIIKDEQKYWFDHPIQIGVELEKNEVVYGLKGLSETLEYEKKQGKVDNGASLNCLLSVSVTHDRLKSIAKEYIREELKKAKGIKNLKVYIFTEEDTASLIDQVLAPAVRNYLPEEKPESLFEVFGVDGEYSRHYSFLKAIAALWQVLINPEIKGTFKIDLDQVFPQKNLEEESGNSAFEHFKTPLWGSTGTDNNKEVVDLSLIAGALVNERDINNSIYTPDVDFPSKIARADELIFSSWLCSAISTRAEMMTRYDNEYINGVDSCLQRIHVTGGTTGILVDALRKYRPFTPTFIGRAEDQAYIISVLHKNPDMNLRYLHKDGLFMRHDKMAFASQAIEAAKIGSMIGDYIRILVFSQYTLALPWPQKKTKELIDPFTGSFVSKIPISIVYLRFALKVASFFEERQNNQGLEFYNVGIARLYRVIKRLIKEPDYYNRVYKKEQKSWNIYYDILDFLEKALVAGDDFGLKIKKKAEDIVENCLIELE